MGLFSVYTGFIYNDIFSKTLHLFRSGWTFSEGQGNIVHGEANGHVYPFGLDPGWHGADNALIFTNSYKMKMSIILGVTHVCKFLVLMSVYGAFLNPLSRTDDICPVPASS
jgi:V-type H+-transporting ATPase subunit a